MSDVRYETKYNRLKDSIQQWWCEEKIDGLILRDTPWALVLKHVHHRAAEKLVASLLEAGMIEFTKLGPADMDDYDRVSGVQAIRANCWLVRPYGADVHRAELAKAKQEGYDLAVREIYMAAERYKGLDTYGPVIGNAVAGIAGRMRMKDVAVDQDQA